jgi:hypothetical protein
MRINVYTEELYPEGQPLAEIVWIEYISSRTGEKMRNYGLRIYVKSHPDLHYIPGRDDDRSAITFWVGPKEKAAFELLENIRQQAYASTLNTWREKTEVVQKEAEAAIK